MSFAKACPNCGTSLPDDAREGAVCSTCAGAATVIEPFRPDSTVIPISREVVGDFEILGKLGQGGMGAVYRARQTSLDRFVALKVLPAQFVEDEDYISRFRREGKVAASLNHPNLVRVYSFGVADGCHFIAMELVEGEDLHRRIRRGALAAERRRGPDRRRRRDGV